MPITYQPARAKTDPQFGANMVSGLLGLTPVPLGVAETGLFKALQGTGERSGLVTKHMGETAPELAELQEFHRPFIKNLGDDIRTMMEHFRGKTPEQIADPSFRFPAESVDPDAGRYIDDQHVGSVERLSRNMRVMGDILDSIDQQFRRMMAK